MRAFHQWLSMALLAGCLYSADSVAGSGVSASTGVSVESVLPNSPDQAAVEAFTRHAEFEFADYGEGKARVSDRILDGFEAGPTLLVTAEGSSIRWGFKYQEGSIESVVIGDKSGQLKLLAAVDGMSRLTSLSSSPINTMSDYEQRQKRSGMFPSVTVFVHDDGDLKASTPLLKRWLQANLMGFNTDCSKPDLAGACKLAEQIVISTTAYVITGHGNLRSVSVPDVKAASVSLKLFVQ